MNYDTSDLNDNLNSIYVKNQFQIENNLPFQQKKDFEQGLKKLESDSIKVTLGGPIQTITTGIIGLIILLFRKNKIKINGLKNIDWLAVFLSLFWLREVFNLLHSVGFEMIFHQGSYFNGDEKYISEYLNLNSGTIPILLAAIGIVILVFVIFEIIPKHVKLPFILSGLIGGISGFFLWFEIIGPIIIP